MAKKRYVVHALNHWRFCDKTAKNFNEMMPDKQSAMKLAKKLAEYICWDYIEIIEFPSHEITVVKQPEPLK